MVVVALLSVDLVESVDLVSVDLVVNCINKHQSILMFFRITTTMLKGQKKVKNKFFRIMNEIIEPLSRGGKS